MRFFQLFFQLNHAQFSLDHDAIYSLQLTLLYLKHRRLTLATLVISLALTTGTTYLVTSFDVTKNSAGWNTAIVALVMLVLPIPYGLGVTILYVVSQAAVYELLGNKTLFPLVPHALSLLSQISTIILVYFFRRNEVQRSQELNESRKELQMQVSKQTELEKHMNEVIADLREQTSESTRNKTALVNVLEDLNQEKHKLLVRETELLEAQRIGHFGSFRWNIRTNKTTWSAEAFRIHGLSTDEVAIPMDQYFRIIHPDDQHDAMRAMREALQSTQTHEYTYRVCLRNGQTLWIKAVSSVEKNEQGDIILKGTFQDITKEMDSKIKIEQERLKDEAMLSSIADGLFMTDSHGVITLINKAAQELIGLSSHEIVGRSIQSIFPIKNRKKEAISSELRPNSQALHTKQTITGVYYYTRRDGSDFPAAITVAPVVQNNEVIGVIEVFRDVTREEAVDRMKTEFLSLASHQLRTPLAAMKWNLEMLLEGDMGTLNDKQQKLTANVNLSNERMIDLVNALLNVSRIESGRIIIEPKPTDIATMITNVTSQLQHKIDDKKQTLQLNIAPSIPSISLDTELIQEAISNLLTNAIKYTPDGGSISIHAQVEGDQVSVSITDTGYGIPEKDQSKIFDKFFRASNIVKKDTDGNGLGLYLVQQIVRASGGSISFTSKSDEGTTFIVKLPLAGSKPQKGEVRISHMNN